MGTEGAGGGFSRRRFLLLSGSALLAACTSRVGSDPDLAPGDPAAVPEDGPETLIAGAAVFDGVRSLDGPHDVLIRGDTIAEVGVGLPERGVDRVVDAEGLTLMPGLIDAHVHLWSQANLAKALLFGVTTQLDMFSHPANLAGMRRRQEGSSVYGDLRSAGHLATAPEGHGTQFDIEVPTLTHPSQAAGWVADRRDEGSDYIKIVAERRGTMELLDLDIIAALVESAHEQDLMAVAHVSEAELARAVVEAGSDGLAHVFVDDVEVAPAVEACRAADAFVIATLAVYSPFSSDPISTRLSDDPRVSRWLTEADIAALQVRVPGGSADLVRHGMAGVRSLHDAGVTVLAGSDAPNPGTLFGVSLHGELELLVEAGLAPTDALAAATGHVAERFRLHDRGRIAVGMRADLLLVDGDPTVDVTATRAIEAIYRSGRRIDRQAVAAYAS